MDPDEQAIRDLVARWHAATAAGDVDTVLGLMAADVTFISTGNPPMHGRDAFGEALRGLLRQCSIQSSGEVQEVAVSGALAYCWTNLAVRITPHSGEPVVRGGSAISILRKQANGNWLLSRDANMLSPVP